MVLGTEFKFSFSSTKLAPASDIYPWLGMRQDLPKQHGQHILQMWSTKIQNLMVVLDFGEIFCSSKLYFLFSISPMPEFCPFGVQSSIWLFIFWLEHSDYFSFRVFNKVTSTAALVNTGRVNTSFNRGLCLTY